MKADAIFDEIKVDEKMNDLAKIIAIDLENRNKFPLLLLSSEGNASNVKELALLIKKHVLNYQDILEKPEIENEEYNSYYRVHAPLSNDTLSGWIECLMVWVVQRKSRTLDDYSENMENFELLRKYDLAPDEKYGLIELTDEMELRNHGLIVKGGALLYLHQFLRRDFTGNFVDIPGLLRDAFSKGYRVNIRLDPFRESKEEFYQEFFERDYWYGKSFDKQLLKSKDKQKMVTTHGLDESDANHFQIYQPNLSKTLFRTSMMDLNQRQFYIEEYNIPDSQKSKYFIQKIAHFVYDQNKGNFEHLDCSVRIFNHLEYEEIFSNLQSGNQPTSHIGNRYKLFKVSTELDLDIVKNMTYAFFRDNPHIMEYFCNMTTKEVTEFLRDKC